MFSGGVKVTLMFEDNSWRAMGGGLVRFKPFARTAWHSHPAGQTLIVLKGEIITQAEGEEARILTLSRVLPILSIGMEAQKREGCISP